MNRQQLHESIVRETRFTFSHSGGHGGQNINKLNTKVYAAIQLLLLEGLTEQEFLFVRQRLINNINQNGELFLSIQQERTQELNRQIALSRLEEWISEASIIPKIRRKTRPSNASHEKRIKIKKLHSTVKKFRRPISISTE